MASINRIVRDYTHEGAPARKIDVVSQLERSVMSCLLWENEFYESGEEIAKRIASLVAQCPAEDVAKIALQAKQDMRLRHAPLLLLRELMRTKEGKAQAKHLFPSLISRPDDATEFLAIYWKDGKTPLAKQAKRHLGEAMRQFDEYQLAKYSGGAKAVKPRDVLRITRPKPADDVQAELWRKLIKGELATPDTWEVELSRSTDKKASWERLIREGRLGGLAFLRNIRNMRESGVASDEIAQGIDNINAGRLLPMNFISAARHNPQFEPQLERKFLECFQKEKAGGVTSVLVDVSGSMDSALSGRSELRRLDVACALAMIARETFRDVRVFTFSQHVVEVPARQGFALRDAIIHSQPHGGTYLGAAVKVIMGQAAPDTERLIVITDEQSHDPVPDMNGYMINVANNKHGVGYGKWLHIDGWSDKVIDYILRYEGAKND